MDEAILEFVNNRGATLSVDAASGVIRGVKVLGLKSANGRVYRESAIAKAIGMYEGAKVNVDHPKDANDPRSYSDRLGQVKGVRQQPDGLYGDLHYNPKHPLAEQLAWDAANAPENLGLSHNVMARTSKQGGNVVIEEILKVNSVDLVADPATTRGLFEHEERNMDPITLEAVKADRSILEALRAEFVAEQKASGETKALADKLAAAEAALTEAKKTIDEFEVKEKIAARKALATKVINESELPDEFVSDTFRESVEAAKDEAAMKVLVDDRKSLVGLAKKNTTATSPKSKAQHVAEGKGGSDWSGVNTVESALAMLRS